MRHGPTLILAAVTTELKPLVARLCLSAKDGMWVGLRDGRMIIAAATGIGPDRARRAARRLLGLNRPGRVLITGVAGALRRSLRVGNVVIPRELVDVENGARHWPVIDADTAGVLLTCRRLISTPEEKAALGRSYDADAVDMESAALAAVCDASDTPWLCLRAISDAADTRVPGDLVDLVDEGGVPRLRAAAALALSRPQRIGALVRVALDTRVAARALAGRVCEWLGGQRTTNTS